MLAMKNLLAASVVVLTACGGGGGGGGDSAAVTTLPPGQSPTTTVISVLNWMSTSSYVKDGVNAIALVGKSSTSGSVSTTFPFVAPLKPEASVNVYMDAAQCNVYWDITPVVDPASKLTLIPNSGKQLYVPCGKTLACKATIKYLGTTGFADLSCSAPT